MELDFPNCSNCGLRRKGYFGEQFWDGPANVNGRCWQTSETQKDIRVFTCVKCGHRITPDYERTADGNKAVERGTFQAV